MAHVVVGIDYGTSSSKIVVSDNDAPGGAYVFPLVGSDGSARIPSGIRRTAMGIELGQLSTPATASEVYDSVKMRLAARAGLRVTGPAFYEDGLDPSGWTDEELAVVSVAWLQHLAMRAPRRSDGEATYQFLLAVPASFREVHRVQRMFVNVARAAAKVRRELTDLTAKIGTGSPQHFAVRRAIEETNARHRGEVDDDEFEDWLQTETAAATAWLEACNPSLRSHRRAYILTDIGAGTVNLSALLFRPDEEDGKETSILAACSGHTAVNAVAVAAHNRDLPMSHERAVDEALKHTSGLRDALRAPLHVLFARIQEKNSNVGRAWDQWARDAYIIGIGGGSRLGNGGLLKVFQPGVGYRDVTHPIEPLRALRPPELKAPTNFRAEEFVNLAVAYGLVRLANEVRKEVGPKHIEPITRDAATPPSRCRCGGANDSCARCGGSGLVTQAGESYAARIGSYIAPNKAPKRSERPDPRPSQLSGLPKKPKVYPLVPDAIVPRTPTPVWTPDAPMQPTERRHFGKKLQLIAAIAPTVRKLSLQGVRKPAAVASALNDAKKLTLANERWTPRLAWLLLRYVFNEHPEAPGNGLPPKRETRAVEAKTAAQEPAKPTVALQRRDMVNPRTTSNEGERRTAAKAKGSNGSAPAEPSSPPKPVSQDVLDAWVRNLSKRR
jgi:hypothetical protein